MTDWKDIRALAIDIDGVMTRGDLLAFPDGTLLRSYNAKDTFALRMASMKGLRVAVITGARGEAVIRRFTGLGVKPEDLYLNSSNKPADLGRFCDRTGLSPDRIAYVGDDLPDLPVMKLVGLSVAPSDAVPEVRNEADVVTEEKGGCGCVRSVVTRILKAQGKWDFDPMEYSRSFSVTDTTPDKTASNG